MHVVYKGREFALDRRHDAASLRWRRWLLALCAVALLSLAADVVFSFVFQADSAAAVPTSVPWVQRVVKAPPQSALQAGDLVNVALLTPAERYRWFNVPIVGERRALTVSRNGRTRIVTFTPPHGTYLGAPFSSLGSWPYWFATAGELWLLFFAALLAWRRPESAEVRVLALLLMLYVLGSDANSANWQTPLLALDVTLAVLSSIMIFSALALLATFAMFFARPPGGARRTLMWLSYASAASAASIGIVGVIAPLTSTIDPASPFFTNVATNIAVSVAPYLLPFLCTVAAVAAARGAERARVAWATSSIGLMFLSFALLGLVQSVNPSAGRSAIFLVGNCTLFIAPMGLTYSLLNRRLLDIGFALNRAAIFVVVSSIVVGIFVLFEWFAGEWLRSASGSTNVAIAAIVVLVLGFSLRAIHAKIELVVDRVMFRKRHEDEQALRAFAHEAAYFTDGAALLHATQDTLETRADASTVTLEIHDGNGHYGSIAENDPAFVALRTWHKRLDLHTVRTDLAGEFAYPMVARGRLLGALVIGPKRSGDAYAPDESDAIARIASGVANALDVLSLKSDNKLDELLEAVRGVREGMQYLVRRVDALSDGAASK